MLPKVSSHCCAHKWIQILASICARTEFRITHRTVHCTDIAGCGRGENICVMTRTRFIIPDLSILAVWYFRNELACVVHWVKRLGPLFILVGTRSWVFSRRIQLILDVNGRFKYASVLLG